MPKRKPIPANDHTLTHAQEMTRRRLDRASRTPARESRSRVRFTTDATPYRIHTMFNGIRIRANGLPRSRTYRHLPPTNHHGEPRR